MIGAFTRAFQQRHLIGLSNKKSNIEFPVGFIDFSKAPCELQIYFLIFLFNLHLKCGIVKEIQKGRDQKANAQETPRNLKRNF